MFQTQEDKERKRQQQAEYLRQLERDIQDKQIRQNNENELPIIPKNNIRVNVPPNDNIKDNMKRQQQQQQQQQQQLLPPPQKQQLPQQQYNQVDNIDISTVYGDLELVKQALVDEMKGRQLLEQRIRPQIDTIMDQMSSFFNETVSSSNLAQRLMKLEGDNSIISSKVNSYGSRVEMVGEHLSKMSRAMLAEEATRLENESTVKYLVRESQEKTNSTVEELRQFITSKYNTIESLQNNILEIKEDVENTHKLPGFALLQAASGTKQPNSVLEALVAKVAKMSTDLENQKEINMSLSREIVTIRENLSQETAQSANLSQELRSVLSAEITARRKGLTKINETVERLILTQKDELISSRKEFQMLAENLSNRMEASENHINNIANTVLREIRETRDFARKGIDAIELELKQTQEQIFDHRRGNNNEDNKSGSPTKRINSNVSEADIMSRILILEDNIDKKLRSESEARYEGDTVLRDFIDSIQQSLGKKLEDTVGRLKALIAQKLDEHETQIDVHIKQILTDVSEEIAFCINEESDRRFEEIQTAENRIYAGLPRRKIATPDKNSLNEMTAARLASRINTPDRNSSYLSDMIDDNDSYVPEAKPQLELQKLSSEDYINRNEGVYFNPNPDSDKTQIDKISTPIASPDKIQTEKTSTPIASPDKIQTEKTSTLIASPDKIQIEKTETPIASPAKTQIEKTETPIASPDKTQIEKTEIESL